jgi:predicted nucleotidyltransferase
MLLDAKEKIAGIPILLVRNALKKLQGFGWGPESLGEYLKTSPEVARKVIEALKKLGYVRRTDPKHSPNSWEFTDEAGQFLCAQGGRGITRIAAVQLVEGFLDRVRAVNSDAYYLCWVRRVIAFGSFLSVKEKLGDIDLAVTFERRESDPDRFEKLVKERVALVTEQGRTFSTFVDMLAWPEREVLLNLKSKSRYLKIHSDQDGVLKNTKTRILYEMQVPAKPLG